MHYTRLFLALGLLGLGCRPNYHNPVDTSVAMDSGLFAGPKKMGRVEKKSLDEISGLAASPQFKKLFGYIMTVAAKTDSTCSAKRASTWAN
ncbi:MAG: hypothetical protein HC913_09405 [Microscillaceae bacterium]|nr:hypothetical protein [Microscillaceae bacterium]